jgi:hypothetical protein
MSDLPSLNLSGSTSPKTGQMTGQLTNQVLRPTVGQTNPQPLRPIGQAVTQPINANLGPIPAFNDNRRQWCT